jgi:hypothetical protein
LHGREFELVDRRRCWGEQRVYALDQNGVLLRFTASWTDAGDVDPFVAVSAGRALFRAEDLLELAALIEGLDGGDRHGS